MRASLSVTTSAIPWLSSSSRTFLPFLCISFTVLYSLLIALLDALALHGVPVLLKYQEGTVGGGGVYFS